MKLTLVTGNQGKLVEWRRLLPPTMTMGARRVDLAEIQSLDLEEIVSDKAKRAYDNLRTPVVVEDISAGLQELNWLPGPFIKFFEKELGEAVLYTLAKHAGAPARVVCSIGFYDGKRLFTVKAQCDGTVVKPRGKHGFGFDKVFMPNGSTKTYGEMTGTEKDQVSHRSRAIKLFLAQLYSTV